jgi:hypothetical protein
MFVCLDHCCWCMTLAGGHSCRCGSGCMVDWRHVLCAADAVLPLRPPSSQRCKIQARTSDQADYGRRWQPASSRFAARHPHPILISAVPPRAHLLLQEKRCAVSDLRAMLSMPWFLDSVPTSLEPSITPSPTLSPHVALSLSPQFFTKSSVDESKSSQPPCKPRRSCLKGFGRWSLKMTTKVARATSRRHHSVRALTL